MFTLQPDLTILPVKSKTIGDFLEYASSIPTLDVRSPGEYRAGHILSAHSLPLFSDEERAVIGTLYKQEGKKIAVKKGLDLVGPKMRGFIEQAETFQSNTLALYCWRGGMRSESMAWLLERYGFETVVLQGGYKAYRRHQIDFFSKEQLPLRVVTGYTGSKKTEFLHLLKAEGAQVVDLEGLAQHQGSSFGNRKCTGQPSTEHFQNQLFEVFRKFDLHQNIWIEDECMCIGKVNLPEGLFRQMNQSPHLFLEVEKSQRIDFLVEDYGQLEQEQLIQATQSIAKNLGAKNTALAIDHLQKGDLKAAAAIILTYYDASYHKSIARKQALIKDHYRIDMQDLPGLATTLAGQKLQPI